MKEIKNTKTYILPGTALIIILIVVLNAFIIGNNETVTESNSGWQLQSNLQTLLNGRAISDMTFTDSVTGYAVTPYVSLQDSAFIYKTTNGGYNWSVLIAQSGQLGGFDRIKFINSTTGFVCGLGTTIWKTTNSGNNWYTIGPFGVSANKMSILNEDTIYFSDFNGLTGGVFRTTNGGLNWQRLWWAGNLNPYDIHMVDSRVGFYTSEYTWKTTNGGYNWHIINDSSYIDIHFIDTLRGYRVRSGGTIQKTTNGGFNWASQTLPKIAGTSTINIIRKLYFTDIDTIWAVGAMVEYSNPVRKRGLINMTTNGGINWGYQLPDTHNINIILYSKIYFFGTKHGWAYWELGKGVHTTTGGDSTIYVGINNQNEILPDEYSLEQNYPNPFNSITNVKFQMLNAGVVEIKVYDLRGKFIRILTSKKYNAGEYTIKFDARHGGSSTDLPSGVYFYSMFVNGKIADTKKAVLIK